MIKFILISLLIFSCSKKNEVSHAQPKAQVAGAEAGEQAEEDCNDPEQLKKKIEKANKEAEAGNFSLTGGDTGCTVE